MFAILANTSASCPNGPTTNLMILKFFIPKKWSRKPLIASLAAYIAAPKATYPPTVVLIAAEKRTDYY